MNAFVVICFLALGDDQAGLASLGQFPKYQAFLAAGERDRAERLKELRQRLAECERIFKTSNFSGAERASARAAIPVIKTEIETTENAKEWFPTIKVLRVGERGWFQKDRLRAVVEVFQV